MLNRPLHALDTAQGVADDGKAAGIVLDPGGVKVFRQGADAPGDGIGLGIVGQVVDVVDDRFRFCRKRRQVVVAAPIAEVVPVRAIGVDSIGRPGRIQALAGFMR